MLNWIVGWKLGLDSVEWKRASISWSARVGRMIEEDALAHGSPDLQTAV